MMQPQKSKSLQIKKSIIKSGFKMAIILVIILNGFLSSRYPASAASLSRNIYYVSPSGSDNNSGTLSLPWKTIGKSANMIAAGDSVIIRGGIYQERVVFDHTGTNDHPIIIKTYPGETPILDGNNYTIPSGTYSALLQISGDYVQVSGLEVRYSRGMGVVLAGMYDVADNINSHQNIQNGILVTGNYSSVENSRIWSNCLSNFNGGSLQSWASGLSAARNPNGAVIRNNIVYGNWGEGISTFEANGTIIEGNTVYDNWSANVYISDATNVLFQHNLVYATGAMIGGDQVGIMMGDETYNPPSANIKVINNIAYGNNRNFYWWQGNLGGGMNNVLVANNTFVNSNGTSDVIIATGSHQNVRFENNIMRQDGSLPVILTTFNSQVTYSNNLWSKTPISAAAGPGDILGDPKLAMVGQPYAPDWFRLTNSSPAIDKALPITDVVVDFFHDARGANPDIGANEITTIGLPLDNGLFIYQLPVIRNSVH